ncbi:OadG family protein [Myxococcota bacterium]|nr:OadG family protein [Myxococcota bacterium]MBU1381593.1 OadG family protein [Myxococcota bacterium]MBU1496863.1 OadG family protein [Myxococcota bacterium]
MQEGLTITLFGMGVVFTVLAIIWLFTLLLSKLDLKFAPAVATSSTAPVASSSPVFSKSGPTDEELAAAKAAIAAQTGTSPDQFDLIVK